MLKIIPLLLVGLLLTGLGMAASDDEDLRQTKLADLGTSLFFDVNLSQARTQSCATCHDPARAFSDWRDSGVGAAASLGADMSSLGDRNAPTLSYVALTPEFHINEEGSYVGGMFMDGRETNLAAQAGAPPLNPIEMAFPDKASVVARLQESPLYPAAFRELFGEDIFTDVDAAYAAMTESIAAYERGEFFSPFDSKYDRYLRGEYEMTREEELGMTLFFSEQFTNCNQCHQLNNLPGAQREVFSDYTFHNIGVPVNSALRQANGLGVEYKDKGLLENPHVTDPAQAGKFKVPTLRNVAITAPYMHNGVFQDLKTVVQFYNKYNSRNEAAQINPETGEYWGEPEIAENISLTELEIGPFLDERRVDALVAFMRLLTDRRYEALLETQHQTP
ncbi:MAG: methylamine utilization protein MauG [Gammaproteobacteria bacterium]|nr:methylamine utilization protein MauG [Gammaproteobacteria bacterium]|tara:strand:+ start:64720 stop:65892 length:1173 start_codon:yes stop_codon:yes gene_type:complete